MNLILILLILLIFFYFNNKKESFGIQIDHPLAQEMMARIHYTSNPNFRNSSSK